MSTLRSIALGLILLLAPGASAGEGVVTSLPVSRLTRQVVVFHNGAEVARVSAPGSRDVELPCAFVPGRTETLHIEVRSLEAAPPADCRQLDPAQLRQLAGEGSAEKVQFVDTLGADVPGAGGPVALPDGSTAAVASALSTAGGITCLFPQAPDPAKVGPGARVRIWGTAWRTAGGAAVLLVEGVRPERADGRRDEAPWQVSARWGGREVLSVKEPGDYPLRLPCANRPGAFEPAGLRVREFRVADIKVDGHPVAAELALGRQAMSYGLQGRAGLDPDCGMLFSFNEPTRPAFVMKTVSFPLSIAFIRDDGTIANIERLDPGDSRVAMPVEPVRYVLEMEQGWFERQGAGPGKTVVIP
jgi:uncharacterized membrane protein (UPF0127 family)